MTLTKKNIGQLFDVLGGDGSWAYQLVAVKGKDLLFYSFGGDYWVVDKTRYNDWRPFSPQPHPKNHIGYGWKLARRIV